MTPDGEPVWRTLWDDYLATPWLLRLLLTLLALAVLAWVVAAFATGWLPT